MPLTYRLLIMAKRTKKAIRRSVKTLTANGDLIVHEYAIKPYQIFCELIEAETNEFVSSNTLLLEVVDESDQYRFFDGFREVSILTNSSEISIRRVILSNAEIERRAWSCLMNEFINLDPINPNIFNAIKNSMPIQVQRALFDNSLTIQRILDIKNIERHQYDYQVKLMHNQYASEIPSFSELIDEVRYADSK